jgi:CDP-diacylglycerol--glycerol-3-phosphate 3-phosphatidyltransferase
MASLSAGRVNPNWITFSGFLLTVFAGYFLLSGRYYQALALIIVGGIFDYVDGKVAARTNRVTLFGAIFDSVLDRYSDMVVFVALAVNYYRNDHSLSALIAIIALVGAFMTSYIKAIGKSHGLDFRTGFLRRQERVTVLCIVIGFNFLDPYLKNWLASHWNLFVSALPNLIVLSGVWFLAVFSNITALQRLFKLRAMARETDIGR